jgi:hypothetical protein
MIRKALVLDPKDTVAVLLEKGSKGDKIVAAGEEIVLLEDVDFAHKVLIVDSNPNDPVIKYGVNIGYMKNAAPKGTWIHGHNMGCDRGKRRRD